MMTLLLRAGGFASSTIILGLTSLVTAPVLIGSVGARDWALLATGTAVGTLAGAAVSWGWGVTGPSAIAVRDPAERHGYYRQSLLPRVLLLVPAGGVAVAVAWIVAPGSDLSASLMALATTSYGVASPWYFIGEGRSQALLVNDTLPRAAANLGGALVAHLTGSATAFAAVQLIGVLLTLVLTHRSITRNKRRPVGSIAIPAVVRASLAELRLQRAAVGASLVTTAYSTLPLILVSAFAPALAPVFTMGDRFIKWSATALASFTQVLQGWIPARDGDAMRARRGLSGALAMAGITALIIATAGPRFGILLSHGQIDIGVSGGLSVALAVFAMTVTRVAGPSILIPAGEVVWVLRSAVLGAVVLILLVLPLLSLWGAQGALLSVGLAECAVLVTQLVVVRKVWSEE